jgi:hypothetical protein
MTRRLGWLVAVAFAASCGGGSSSTSPSSNLNLTGTWSGRFEYQTAGATVSDDVTMVISQPSTTATGNWSAGGLTTGTVSFAAVATVSGAFTITQTNIASAACTGSSTISGTATATDLVFTVANVAQTAACPWATGMKFTLKK